jgi:hypothetical protein
MTWIAEAAMMTTKTSSATLTAPTANEQPQKSTNDFSNPQQGSTPTTLEGTPMRPQAEPGPGRTGMMKSPPTKKDSRKLFVGGLPADGKRPRRSVKLTGPDDPCGDAKHLETSSLLACFSAILTQ